MITATLSTAFDTEPSTGATEPMLVQADEGAIISIAEETASLVATFNIEVIQADGVAGKKDKPNMNSTLWMIDKSINVISSAPTIKVSNVGGYWVRVIIPSGGYTSGEAAVAISKFNRN